MNASASAVEAFVIDAFAELGIDAQSPIGEPDTGIDLVLDPDGLAVPIQMKYRSLVTDQVAERLLTENQFPETTLFVVSDRLTDTARRILVRRRCGYLDLRGRLALRTGSVVIDAEVKALQKRLERSEALSGKAGLEVAASVLMRPERTIAVRELARELGRSPSTVSEILAALRRDSLVDAKNMPTSTDLFWQVAKRWLTPRVHLAALPSPGDATLVRPLRLNLDTIENEPGWALTDSAAAAMYGAPLAFRSDQTLDFFVPDSSIVRRATTLLGTAASAMQAKATLRVAPVPAVVDHRVDFDANPLEWPLTHPLFVALDLAQDAGRGREILDAWTPDDRWTRVW
ncbi:helix-turn-helix domain-containing protein [Rhodococcus erythropolis]|uniref:helix-turn-helix domain-containing protein n=1 Tax=Rhodococcus erythropolis TaxID=1833 RepID=UPI001BE92AD6|nr:helix-turn-helix domain-containing protein [Rhodococcus erythropolis]MBT2267665.1 helix-turn-helix transcriptional regulator [Rhodococcus erythropolis]